MKGFTVFLVDDDAAVVRALSRLLCALGYDVAGFTSPEAFLERHDPEMPGCAVLDIAMPGLGGLELQMVLNDGRTIPRPVIFLTGQGDIPASVRAMKAGAVNFLTKPVDRDALTGAIAEAVAHDAAARRSFHERTAILARLATLTPREREVLGYVTAGQLNKQVAACLGTVEKTIKVHRARMMRKMGVRSLVDLVRIAERSDIAELLPGIGPTANSTVVRDRR